MPQPLSECIDKNNCTICAVLGSQVRSQSKRKMKRSGKRGLPIYLYHHRHNSCNVFKLHNNQRRGRVRQKAIAELVPCGVMSNLLPTRPAISLPVAEFHDTSAKVLPWLSALYKVDRSMDTLLDRQVALISPAHNFTSQSSQILALLCSGASNIKSALCRGGVTKRDKERKRGCNWNLLCSLAISKGVSPFASVFPSSSPIVSLCHSTSSCSVSMQTGIYNAIAHWRCSYFSSNYDRLYKMASFTATRSLLLLVFAALACLQVAQAIQIPMAKCVEEHPQNVTLTTSYEKIHKSKFETIYQNPFNSQVYAFIKKDFARYNSKRRILNNGSDKTRRMALKVKAEDGQFSTHYFKLNPNFKCYLEFADKDKIVAVNRYKEVVATAATTPAPVKNNRRCPPKTSK